MIAGVALALGIVVALPTLMLALLTVASLLERRHVRTSAERSSVAVLIAAHDEAEGIGTTLAAIARVAPGLRVHVVADNCRDRTAEQASAAGACVHVRSDDRRRGKPAALNFLAAEVLREDDAAAFVFLDADARPEPGFFDALRRALGGGALVAQAKNLVLPSAAPLSRLRELAFHLKCDLRPRAYAALGLSAGLHGNGMCLRRELIARYPWNEGSVVEDGEMHLRLVRDGVGVSFAPDATVRSPMPMRFDGAAGQAVRWERGKVDLSGAALRLIALGARERRVEAIVAGCDVLIPPLSFLVALSGALTVAAITLESAPLQWLAGACLVSIAAYLARGLALARIDAPSLARMTAWAGPYLGWKVLMFARAVVGSGRGQWTQARPHTREVNG